MKFDYIVLKVKFQSYCDTNISRIIDIQFDYIVLKVTLQSYCDTNISRS